jgi:exopolysaccharide production protein ExoY
MLQHSVFATPTDAQVGRNSSYVHLGKRLLDLFFVLLFAPVVVPIVVGLALLVRIDGGSAFYYQDRIGRNGRVFRIWKIRSMVMGADALLEAHLKADPAARAEWVRSQKLLDDPRVTRLGRLIRKTSLDELPQLWNVFVGDMSLVGPRPMLPCQAALYPGKAYFRVRPGLTGFWQISSRNRTSFAARARFDTFYAEEVSFVTDIRVLLATFRVVFRGTGV